MTTPFEKKTNILRQGIKGNVVFPRMVPITTSAERAFRNVFLTLERRISLFLCLPLATIDKLAIRKEIDKIGHQ